MRNFNSESFIIFARNMPYNPELKLYMPELKIGVGAYKGVKEVCYIVGGGQERLELVMNLAYMDGQESILSVENGQALLHYINGNVAQLGTWKNVPYHYATKCEAYTLFDGNYFVAE